MAKQAKQKKTEKKVVITKGHFEALELLAKYGADLLDNKPPILRKGANAFEAAERVFSWASDIEQIFPTDKKTLKLVDGAIGLAWSEPEEYVEAAKEA